MGSRLAVIPSPGIRSVNGVVGNGLNIELTSSDSSLFFTPDNTNRTIDITLGSVANAGTVLQDVPCDNSVQVGRFVRMNSGVAYHASAASVTTSQVLGIVEAKSSSTLCNVRFLGLTTPILAGLDESADYFLSTDGSGQLTTTAPTTAGQVVLKLGKAFSATQFVVMIGDRYVRS